MVVAASGAGKSSLLRAGLLPSVAAGALTRPDRGTGRSRVHPGRASPARGRCRPGGGLPGGSWVPAEPGAGDLDALLARAAGAAWPGAAWPGARAVLVVDQFEELFRLCEHEDERGRVHLLAVAGCAR